MHELSITQNILDISLRAAAAQGAKRIRVIRLELGPFSGVVPECVQMYLDVLGKGTAAEGARIEARRLPLRVECRTAAPPPRSTGGTSSARRAARCASSGCPAANVR